MSNFTPELSQALDQALVNGATAMNVIDYRSSGIPNTSSRRVVGDLRRCRIGSREIKRFLERQAKREAKKNAKNKKETGLKSVAADQALTSANQSDPIFKAE